jgi:hypothetical protein
VNRWLIAFGSAWFVFSVTIATMVFPALVRASVICDGIDDDDLEWQLAVAVRDHDSKRQFVIELPTSTPSKALMQTEYKPRLRPTDSPVLLRVLRNRPALADTHRSDHLGDDRLEPH